MILFSVMTVTPDKVIRTKRRSIEILVDSAGRLVVRAPTKMLDGQINDFLHKKQSWIIKNKELALKNIEKSGNIKIADIPGLKIKAEREITKRAGHFSKISGLRFNKIRISGARRRWGSCSVKNNLAFSWRLILAPTTVIDYVVAHELAHTQEKNHSKKFWDLVKKIYPNYKESRKWLKENPYLLEVDYRE